MDDHRRLDENELQIPCEHLRPYLLIIEVPEVNQELDHELFSFGSALLLISVHGVHQQVLVEAAVVHVCQSIDLVRIFNPMVVDRENQLLELYPR